MVQYDVEAFMAACERKGLAAKTMGSYEQTLRLFGQFLSVREIERTEEVKRVHARKMNFVNLYGPFYDATHNYTGVEGADDEAVRNRIEAQTAQFFRQTLLCVGGDVVNSGIEIKENIPYALGVKTSGCMRGDFLFVCSFSAACLSGDKMLYSKYILIRKEEKTWIL